MLALFAFVVLAPIIPTIAIPVAFGVVTLSALGVPRSASSALVRSAGRSLRKLVGSTYLSVGAIALALLLGGIPVAQAEPEGTTHLMNANVDEMAGIDIGVTASHSGGNLVLSVQLITNPLSNIPRGIDQFFYNNQSAGPVASVDDPRCTSPHSWRLNFDGSQANGFGNFNSRRNECDGGSGGISDPIVFMLSGDPAIEPNNQGGNYAIHIRFSGDCSGWVSDGTPAEEDGALGIAHVDEDEDCVRGAEIPGVSDILIPTTGLVAMIWFVRRRSTGKTGR